MGYPILVTDRTALPMIGGGRLRYAVRMDYKRLADVKALAATAAADGEPAERRVNGIDEAAPFGQPYIGTATVRASQNPIF